MANDTTLSRIIRGFGTLPGYGPHPGVPVAILIVVGSGNWRGAIIAAVAQVLWVIPLLCVGAYSRAKECENHGA